MKRYYGVIQQGALTVEGDPNATSDMFINQFYDATVNTLGNSPLHVLSDYTWLTSIGNDAKAKAFNRLATTGYYTEAESADAELAVLNTLTRNATAADLAGKSYETASLVRFAANLYLVVERGLDDGEGSYGDGWSDHLTRVKIIHIVEEEQETETEVTQVNEETEEEETITTTTTEIVKRPLIFQFGSNNSNANSPAVAYEITPTYSGDVLVKFAWCPNECEGTEVNLKYAMSGLDICCYEAMVDQNVSPPVVIMTNSAGTHGHTAEVFGEGGARGGFIYHKLKKGNYGITIFNADRTPLYTWSPESKPFDELDEEHLTPRNVNYGGIGRIINPEKLEGSDQTLLKMSALAPIFCPAVNDFADTAKWMPQGLHDYSYFDKSGHIRLEKAKKDEDSVLFKDEDSVFFADHGVYLWDGPISNFTETTRSLPDAAPENLVQIKRPDASNWLFYAARFSAIYDCLDGYGSGLWMNTVDGGSPDMQIFGSPVVNSDKTVRFLNAASGYSGGWVPFTLGNPSSGKGSIEIALFKFKYNKNETIASNWYAMLFGPVFDQTDAASFGYGHSLGAHAANDNYLTYNIGNNDQNPNRKMAALSENTWYILITGPSGTGNSYRIKLSAFSDGSSIIDSYVRFDQIYNNTISTNYFVAGYPDILPSWKDYTYQGKGVYPKPDAWVGADDQSPYPTSNIELNLAFLALGDVNGYSLMAAELPSGFIDRIIADLRDHYTELT